MPVGTLEAGKCVFFTQVFDTVAVPVAVVEAVVVVMPVARNPVAFVAPLLVGPGVAPLELACCCWLLLLPRLVAR